MTWRAAACGTLRSRPTARSRGSTTRVLLRLRRRQRPRRVRASRPRARPRRARTAGGTATTARASRAVRARLKSATRTLAAASAMARTAPASPGTPTHLTAALAQRHAFGMQLMVGVRVGQAAVHPWRVRGVRPRASAAGGHHRSCEQGLQVRQRRGGGALARHEVWAAHPLGFVFHSGCAPQP